MTERIVALDAFDIRFPTSRSLDGSDAMNPAPDYSAAYVIARTSRPGREGHGFTFTIGRGNELCVAAIRSLAPLVVGRAVEETFADMGSFARAVTGDSQLRWVGPEKGVIHLAAAAVINAVWDLYAKARGKPLWKLLADLPAEDLVSCIDFRYLTDVLTPDEASAMLRRNDGGRAARETEMLHDGYPAYTTSAGWLGYDDTKVRRLSRAAVDAGWTHVKMKVGGSIQDDVLGHAAIAKAVAPIRVATGEHAHTG